MESVAHNLRIALGLAIFVEFSFVAAFAAMNGAFNGGQPTTTPPLAQVYVVVAFFVTIAVAVRTWQMLKAADAGDRPALIRMNVSRWALVALLFSAMLPSIYLYTAAAALPRQR